MEIEKGVPIPAARGKYGELAKSIRKMGIGDSFICPEGQRNKFYMSAIRNGIKVTMRVMGDGKVRVWRVS